MITVLRDNLTNNKINLVEEFFKDLHWFNVFLHIYNGVTHCQDSR